MDSENKDINNQPPASTQKRIKLGISGTLVTLLVYSLFVAIVGYYVGTFFSQMRRAQQPTINPNRLEYTTVTPSPSVSEELSTWESYTVDELDLTFSAPAGMDISYNVEVTENTAVPYLLTLYIQNTLQGSDYYQLYGIIQWDLEIPESLDDYKAELNPETIEETTISGYPAIKGQLVGERNRFVTYILLEDGVFSLFTAEPTENNKLLTDKILNTFVFSE